MKKPIVIVAIAIVAVVGVTFATIRPKNKPATGNSTTSANADAQSSTNSNPSSKSYTTNEVQQHDSRSDCWIIVDKGVYDVTSFIGSHPGGSVIVSYCGRDATSAFQNNREHNNGDTASNGNTAQEQLAQMKIGTLQ